MIMEIIFKKSWNRDSTGLMLINRAYNDKHKTYWVFFSFSFLISYTHNVRKCVVAVDRISHTLRVYHLTSISAVQCIYSWAIMQVNIGAKWVLYNSIKLHYLSRKGCAWWGPTRTSGVRPTSLLSVHFGLFLFLFRILFLVLIFTPRELMFWYLFSWLFYFCFRLYGDSTVWDWYGKVCFTVLIYGYFLYIFLFIRLYICQLIPACIFGRMEYAECGFGKW